MSDTSAISSLIQIGELQLLKELFRQIFIPTFVDREIKELSGFGIDISYYLQQDWIITQTPNNQIHIDKLLLQLDRGESEAIVLVTEINADYLLIDERIGTKVAQAYGIQTIGLLGVLIKCKQEGIIKDIEPLIRKLREQAGFWISEKLYQRILKEAKEL